MPRINESLASKKKRAAKILQQLHTDYPEANCALRHRSAWQLLIATILSAQSTDETVNKVTVELFSRYRKPADLANASQEDVEGIVRRSGFFRQKAKNIRGASARIVELHGGRVPKTIDELTALPGVARKTANVVLGTWFGINEGVVVDTHVGRIAERLRLTWRSKDSKDAVKIEQDLMSLLPQEEWSYFSHAVIWHGRGVCSARKPDCGNCSLASLCPSAEAVDEPARRKKKGRK